MIAVVLAAGMGRRFGGNKQWTAIDDRGQTLLEYTLYDAWRTGVDSVVLVVREDETDAVRQGLGRRLARHLLVQYAVQAAPEWYGFENRSRPLGTGHAVLCCGDLGQPFVLCNADDFYGSQTIAEAVENCATWEQSVVTAYPVASTLPDEGRVHRAVCICRGKQLLRLVESTVWQEDGHVWCDDGYAVRRLAADAPVCMNLAVLDNKIVQSAGYVFAQFLQSGKPDGECLLSEVVNDWIDRVRRPVQWVWAADRWCGMTYRRDAQNVREQLQNLVQQGVYPTVLWP